MKATCLAMILLIGSAVNAFATAEETPLPTIEEVRQHLNDWRKDLVAFRIRYETTRPTPGYRRVRDFLMTDTHDYLDTEESWAPERPPEKKGRGGNASKRFYTRYASRDGKDDWRLASLREEPRQTTRAGSSYIITPLYLLLDAHSGRWMDDEYFSENDVRVAGREDVDGESCILLDVQYHYEGKIDGHGSKVWLAEGKDYLIKKIAPNDGPPTGRRDAEYLCTEYDKLDDRWFPRKGEIGHEGTRWQVLEFQDKPTITSETFLPPSQEALVSANPQQPQKPPTSTSGPALPLPAAVPGWSIGSILGLLLLVIGGSGLLFWWKVKDSR